MCIRDRSVKGKIIEQSADKPVLDQLRLIYSGQILKNEKSLAEYNIKDCLLYTSDAADDLLRVDFGGCRIIKKKKIYQSGDDRRVTTVQARFCRIC